MIKIEIITTTGRQTIAVNTRYIKSIVPNLGYNKVIKSIIYFQSNERSIYGD